MAFIFVLSMVIILYSITESPDFFAGMCFFQVGEMSRDVLILKIINLNIANV